MNNLGCAAVVLPSTQPAVYANMSGDRSCSGTLANYCRLCSGILANYCNICGCSYVTKFADSAPRWSVRTSNATQAAKRHLLSSIIESEWPGPGGRATDSESR